MVNPKEFKVGMKVVYDDNGKPVEAVIRDMIISDKLDDSWTMPQAMVDGELIYLYRICAIIPSKGWVFATLKQELSNGSNAIRYADVELANWVNAGWTIQDGLSGIGIALNTEYQLSERIVTLHKWYGYPNEEEEE